MSSQGPFGKLRVTKTPTAVRKIARFLTPRSRCHPELAEGSLEKIFILIEVGITSAHPAPHTSFSPARKQSHCNYSPEKKWYTQRPYGWYDSPQTLSRRLWYRF